MTSPTRWSLRTQIAVVLVLLSTVGAAAAGGVFLRAMVAELEAFEQERLDRAVELASRDWESRWGAHGNDVRFLAATPPVSGMERARANGEVDPLDGSTRTIWTSRLETIFASFLESRPDYARLRLIDLRGEAPEVIRVDRAEGGRFEVKPAEALRARDREPWVAQARTTAEAVRAGEVSATEPFFTAITLDREDGRILLPHRPVSRSMALTLDPEGEPWGVIVADLAIGGVISEQHRDLMDERHYIVANHRGQVLFDSEGGLGFGFEFGADSGIAHPGSALHALLSTTRPTGRTQAADPGLELEAAQVAFLPGSPEEFIALVVQSGHADARAILFDTVRQAAVPLTLVMVLTLGVAAYLGERATRPFRQLAENIARSGVDDDRPIPPSGSPEVAGIAHAFNRSRAELAASLDELRRSNRELGEFAAIASHDLQEPARTVQSFTSMLRAEYASKFDDEGRHMLDFLQSAAQRMQAQVRELLAFSRLGRTKAREFVDLGDVVEAVRADLTVTIDEANARVSAGELPTVEGAPQELRLLFQNLVSNAIKFRREGVAPHIEIVCSRRDPVHIIVRDTGVGIPDDARAQVFDIFRRGHSGGTYEGSGIGLAHCRKIVEGHGGHIWLGNPRAGTEIHFTLNGVMVPDLSA